LEGHLSICNHDRRPSAAHLLDCARRAFHFNVEAAWPVDEVALFDHKAKLAINGLNSRRAVMGQISAERASRAAGGGVFGNVVSGSEESRVCSRRANLHSLASERMATGRAYARVNLPEQPRIHTSVTEVGQ